MASAAPNLVELSVSELSQALKRTVEAAFGLVRVRGEISGFKRHSSGHLYFTLKDADAAIDAVMWKGVAGALRFRPEDGLEVVALGKLTTYPGRSKYQIVVERLEVAGVGALLAQIAERKARLEKEGLFAAERKLKRPYLPVHIGIITSPTGAVIRDILHRLADRFPRRVTLWPVPVQGDAAADAVAGAIAGFNAMLGEARPDLLIVARGGGSIEDLAAFNEENVVRAAAGSAIPLISAVGHETDTTLIDFASSLRAPTPTAAAELAVPVRAELVDMLADLGLRAGRAERRGRGQARERLAGLRLPRAASLVGMPRQRLDDAGDRLGRALKVSAGAQRARLEAVTVRLSPRLLTLGVERERARLGSPKVTPNPALLRARVQAGAAALQAVMRLAESLAPEATLKRGFVIVSDARGGIVTGAGAAKAAGTLALRFADGTVSAHVGGGGGKASSPQGRLF